MSGEPNRAMQRSQAYDILRGMILSGQLEVGQVTSVQDLVERLPFGRSPVRDAILKLNEERLLRVIPRKGIYICGIQMKDLIELAELRLAIELFAIEEAAENYRNAELIDVLERIVALQAECVERGDENSYIAQDERFHLAIVDIVDNDRMREILSDSRRQRIAYGFKGLTLHRNLAESLEEHKRILAAIKLGDKQAARQEIIRHLTRTKTVAIT